MLYISFVVVQSLRCIQLFCDSMNYSPPVSSVHGILQARILEWVVISFSSDILHSPKNRPRSDTLQTGNINERDQKQKVMHCRILLLKCPNQANPQRENEEQLLNEHGVYLGEAEREGVETVLEHARGEHSTALWYCTRCS